MHRKGLLGLNIIVILLAIVERLPSQVRFLTRSTTTKTAFKVLRLCLPAPPPLPRLHVPRVQGS